MGYSFRHCWIKNFSGLRLNIALKSHPPEPFINCIPSRVQNFYITRYMYLTTITDYHYYRVLPLTSFLKTKPWAQIWSKLRRKQDASAVPVENLWTNNLLLFWKVLGFRYDIKEWESIKSYLWFLIKCMFIGFCSFCVCCVQVQVSASIFAMARKYTLSKRSLSNKSMWEQTDRRESNKLI